MVDFNRHLDRSLGWVRDLAYSGRHDQNVLAVLLVETFVRPLDARVTEYALWPLLWASNEARLARLSVGWAQIQLRHWIALGFLQGSEPSWANMRTVMSLRKNYDAAAAILLTADDPKRIAVIYRGQAWSHHVTLLRCAREWVANSTNR